MYIINSTSHCLCHGSYSTLLLINIYTIYSDYYHVLISYNTTVEIFTFRHFCCNCNILPINQFKQRDKMSIANHNRSNISRVWIEFLILSYEHQMNTFSVVLFFLSRIFLGEQVYKSMML